MKTIDLPNNRKLIIEQDEDSDNPRTWDNLGKMVCFHNRYDLGDKHDYRHEHYSGWEEMKKAIIRKEDVAVILPLFLYDHSGITMKTTPFGCRWDSGQVGWIFVSKKNVRENFTVKRLNKKLIEQTEQILIGEVETFDQFISGDVYHFRIENGEGTIEDSCGGFFGSDIKENGMLDHIPNEDGNFILALG